MGGTKCKLGRWTTFVGGYIPHNWRDIARNLEKLPEPKREKLITVLIKLGNEDYKEKKKKQENIKVTVKDIQTIMTDYLKIEISNKD